MNFFFLPKRDNYSAILRYRTPTNSTKQHNAPENVSLRCRDLIMEYSKKLRQSLKSSETPFLGCKKSLISPHIGNVKTLCRFTPCPPHSARKFD